MQKKSVWAYGLAIAHGFNGAFAILPATAQTRDPAPAQAPPNDTGAAPSSQGTSTRSGAAITIDVNRAIDVLSALAKQRAEKKAAKDAARAAAAAEAAREAAKLAAIPVPTPEAALPVEPKPSLLAGSGIDPQKSGVEVKPVPVIFEQVRPKAPRLSETKLVRPASSVIDRAPRAASPSLESKALVRKQSAASPSGLADVSKQSLTEIEVAKSKDAPSAAPMAIQLPTQTSADMVQTVPKPTFPLPWLWLFGVLAASFVGLFVWHRRKKVEQTDQKSRLGPITTQGRMGEINVLTVEFADSGSMSRMAAIVSKPSVLTTTTVFEAA